MKKTDILIGLFILIASMIATTDILAEQYSPDDYGNVAIDFWIKQIEKRAGKPISLKRDIFSVTSVTDFKEIPNFKAVRLTVDQGMMKIPLVLYISNDKKVLISGEIFRDGENITQRLAGDVEFKKIDIKLREKDRIVYNPEGKKTIFMFSDPDCPASKRALEAIKAYRGKDYRVVIKHYPLESIHPEAKKRAIEEQCRWLSKNKPVLSKAEGKERCNSELRKIATKMVTEDIEEGRKIGVTGTPTFIMDGTVIPTLPWVIGEQEGG
ncbi:MAG: thioredoxin fold domain-containing protein [Nitrospirota bacterium]